MNQNTRSAAPSMAAHARQGNASPEHANGDKAAAGNRETPPGGYRFTFGRGDAPIAEMIDDVTRMDFLEQLNVGQIAELCWHALDQHDGVLRRAIDATIVSLAGGTAR
ncbi:hypothetical protein BLA13014_04107 [Burkholderia aenigmatica]|uniref:Uncharacterized protein n=1 Tax=Burkholderia aenigmatica TaxID=2015348 RepID=A0A6P2N3E5_9BURK|nr:MULTISPECIES: hypothetical protein [Burkholderia]VWB88706.1 hypothetical protein BLA13014_04107 [Burkholderia aenigmatica]